MSKGAFVWPLFAVLAALLVRRSLDVVEVRGSSMVPALEPGDRLLVVRTIGTPRAGDVVLARDPRTPARELIKRVAAVGPSGAVLHGDNPSASTDGRTFGALPTHNLRWRAVARYWPPSRWGLVPSSISTGSEPAAHRLSRWPSRQP